MNFALVFRSEGSRPHGAGRRLTPEAVDYVVELAASKIGEQGQARARQPDRGDRRGQAAREPARLDRARMKKELRGMLGQFDELLRAEVPLARQVLRKLLDGPITFDSSSGSYVLSGRTKVGALLANAYIAGVPRKGSASDIDGYISRVSIPGRSS